MTATALSCVPVEGHRPCPIKAYWKSWSSPNGSMVSGVSLGAAPATCALWKPAPAAAPPPPPPPNMSVSPNTPPASSTGSIWNTPRPPPSLSRRAASDPNGLPSSSSLPSPSPPPPPPPPPPKPRMSVSWGDGGEARTGVEPSRPVVDAGGSTSCVWHPGWCHVPAWYVGFATPPPAPLGAPPPPPPPEALPAPPAPPLAVVGSAMKDKMVGDCDRFLGLRRLRVAVCVCVCTMCSGVVWCGVATTDIGEGGREGGRDGGV